MVGRNCRFALLLLTGCRQLLGFHELDDSEVVTLVDDTAADFEPAMLDDASVHPRGAVEPATFAYGGLHMTAYRGTYLLFQSTTWNQLEEDLAQATPTGTQPASSIDVDFGYYRPFGVGLQYTDQFTLVYRGEIYIDGTTTFTLESGDVAIAQIDTDGTFGHRMGSGNGTGSVTVTPPKPGWYPIRAALGIRLHGDRFIRLRTPTGPIAGALLRSRTTGLSGLVVEGFNDPLLRQPAGVGIATKDLALGGPLPFDFQTTGDFSIRLAGQLLIEQPGRYRFSATVVPTAMARLWIDGELVSTRWGPDNGGELSLPITLVAGWHDFTMDHGDIDPNLFILIKIEEAPPGVATGALAGSLLRPVVRFGAIASTGIPATIDLFDIGRVIEFSPLSVPAGAVVQRVDVGYVLDHQAPVQITAKLTAPNGTADTLRTNDPAHRALDYFGARFAFDGHPAVGAATWKLTVLDNTPGDEGAVTNPFVVVGYRAGTGPIAQTATFVSQPRALGDVQIAAVRAIGDQPAGSSVAISIRTCANESACESAEWRPVAGNLLAIDADGLVQYRLELASDGWAIPIVDRVEIDYRLRD